MVVVTEDSGKDGSATVTALVKKLLKQLAPSLRTNEVVIRDAGSAAKRAMRGHDWKSSRLPHRRELVNELATRLVTGDLVVLHYDGDIAWSKRPKPSSHDEAVAKLIDEVNLRVTQSGKPMVGAILALVPHYSVEAWLYLNHDAVRSLPLTEQERARAVAWLRANQTVGGYDHIHKPKDVCPLADKHNLALAKNAWPADKAAERSPSWRQTVARWSDSRELRAHLTGKTPPTTTP